MFPFQELLAEEKLSGAPILVFANKQVILVYIFYSASSCRDSADPGFYNIRLLTSFLTLIGIAFLL